MNAVLARWNGLGAKEAAEEILPCCGSKNWAQKMSSRRPILGETALFSASDDVCGRMSDADWDEAFRSHPRIGESAPQAAATTERSRNWSGDEQKKAVSSDDETKIALAEGNWAYEQRFQRIFIVCATGKSAPEILEILERRLRNDAADEFRVAAEEQRKITHLRLRKWLSS
jgi:2-oxo-4-hydroxy-4-carboxy-5-ureidoimidazoline decarboxylase